MGQKTSRHFVFPSFSFCAAALGFFGVGASAATLADCFQASLKRSEVVADQQELIFQAQERYKQAIGSVLPQVSGVASYMRQQVPSSTIAGVPTFPNQPLIKVGLDQPLFRGFREYAALRQANAQTAAQKESKNNAAVQLFASVAANFYNIISIERDLDNLVNEIDVYDKRIKDLEQRIKIGRSRLSEALTVRSTLGTVKTEVEQDKGQLAAARELFAFLTGLPKDVALEDPRQQPGELKSLAAYTANLDSRPDYRLAKFQLASSEEGITIARGGHWPSIDLLADYYFLRPQSASGIDWDVGAQLTIPLFAGGTIQSGVRVAVSQKTEAELTLERTRRQVIDDISTAYANFKADVAQIGTLEDATTLSEQNYQEENREYRLGLVTNLDVLTAITTFLENRRSLDKQKTMVELDTANLDVSMGMALGKPVNVAN